LKRKTAYDVDINEFRAKVDLCWTYDGEVNNGGHLQYFENTTVSGFSEYQKAVDALKFFGAEEQANVTQGQTIKAYKQYILMKATRFHVCGFIMGFDSPCLWCLMTMILIRLHVSFRRGRVCVSLKHVIVCKPFISHAIYSKYKPRNSCE